MRKLRYLVPNSFTAMSLLLGLASIFQSTEGKYELAAWMILWAVLLDKLDGASARLLDASSEFGAQMDSFADFVSFGIAPAALLFCGLREAGFSGIVHYGWLMASCGVYVVAVAARLARFNVSEPANGHLMFFGIPTTLMGALVASGYLAWDKLGLGFGLMAPIPFLLLILSIAMVSNVKLPKLKLHKNMYLNAFQMGNVLLAYIIAPLQILPEILFLQAVFYVTVGVIWYAIKPPVLEDEVENIVHSSAH